MEENLSSLDLEYKRYLQIMRPYLGQLVDEDAIKLCNAWIQRLSSCSDNEKSKRNKYIFVLCYQLAKGVLEEPFLNFPLKSELPTISEIDSASSSEVDYLAIDDDDKYTKILYNNNRSITSDTYQSRENDFDNTDSEKASTNQMLTPEDRSSKATRKQTILCYTCPRIMTACTTEICSDLCSQAQGPDQYEYRANNLIMRLREIKKQNMLLHKELIALKEESKGKTSTESLIKVNTATSTYLEAESSATVKSIKNKLQSADEDRKNLLQTLESLQEQLDNMHEIKNREIDDMEAQHKIEISKIKAAMRDENKTMYEKKLDDLKNYYENLIKEIKDMNKDEIKNITNSLNEIISQKDKIIQEKDRTTQEKCQELDEKLQSIEAKRNNDLQDKDKTIQGLETEIKVLKSNLEEEKTNFNSIIQKFLGKTVTEDLSVENIKIKAQELERRLNKVEKSKSKCIKVYEAKLANLQREKHLAECSLQLQLMRQRAQVVNEIAEENQGELNTALDKLEAKYKEIIANVQSTAIERRLQDEIAINSIVKAACACNLRNEVNHNSFTGKPTVKCNQETSQSCDSEISGTIRPEVNHNQSYGDDSIQGGYCLNGEKFGQLLQKVYIPQRDYEMPLKK